MGPQHLLISSRLVRDQANKSFDVFVQRVRKYGSTLPDTVLPPPTSIPANGAAPRMGTPQNDTAGWAGWAISSFTNKIGTASGDMDSKATNLQPSFKLERSSSVPPANTARAPVPSASASNLHRQAVTGTSTPTQAETPPEQFFTDAAEEDEGFDEAWGEMGEDSFFDAPSAASEQPKSSATAQAFSYDDSGEPDFEGWLKAQAQAKKSKAPLATGPSKASSQTNGRQAVTRTTTTGSVGSGLGAKKLANTVAKPKAPPPKVISTQPKEADDDWGDAWD